MPTPLQPFNCPACQTVLRTAISTTSEDHPPRVGDLGICHKCASVMRHEEGAKIHVLSEEEIQQYPAEFREFITIAQNQAKVCRSTEVN